MPSHRPWTVIQTQPLGAPPAPRAGSPTPASCAVQPRCGCGCAGQVPCCGLEPISPGGTDPHLAAHRLCHDAFSENMAGEAQLLERRRLYHCAAYTCAIALVRCVFTELRFYQGFLFSEKPEKVGPSRPLAVLPGSRGVGLGVLLGPVGQGGVGWRVSQSWPRMRTAGAAVTSAPGLSAAGASSQTLCIYRTCSFLKIW